MMLLGGNPAVSWEQTEMTFGDVCLLLGLLIAFATLVLKVVEVARHR